MIGMIGVSPGQRLEARLDDPLAEVARVVAQRLHALRMRLDELHRRERARRDRRRKRVREELRTRALREIVAQRRRAGDESARRAAQRLAQRRRDDVHLAEHAEVLGRAAPRPAQHARRVRVVDHQHGVVLARDLQQVGQRRDRAFHREHAVAPDDASLRRRGPPTASLAGRPGRRACRPPSGTS